MKTKARFLVVMLFLATITACVPVQFPEQPVQSPQEQPTEENLVKETEEVFVPTPAVEVEETEAIESGDVEVIEPEEVEEAEPTAIEIPFEPTASTPDPDNLVKNGYFLDGYDYWERELVDEGGSSKMSIRESNNSDFDRELWMNQEGKGSLMLKQLVPIPTTRVIFSATFQISRRTGYSWYGYSYINLLYYDTEQEYLGHTRINTYDITDTNTEHNIKLSMDTVYKNYTIDIHKEITENLLGIDPSLVMYIQIELLAGSNYPNYDSTLIVSDIMIK